MLYIFRASDSRKPISCMLPGQPFVNRPIYIFIFYLSAHAPFTYAVYHIAMYIITYYHQGGVFNGRSPFWPVEGWD